MKPRTREHLNTANENRGLAREMVRGVTTPAARERRAVVIAFYAAVHYVNAYLWETASIAPQNHGDRRTKMQQDALLGPLVFRYRSLVLYAFDARYTPNYQQTAAIVRRALQTMRVIEAAVTPRLS